MQSEWKLLFINEANDELYEEEKINWKQANIVIFKIKQKKKAMIKTLKNIYMNFRDRFDSRS